MTDTSPAKAKLGAGYQKLLAASTISNLGDGVGQLAYPWLATAVTRSPLLIALIAVVRGLPWLVFSLPAGVIVDRKDRRQLMIVMNMGRTVITLGVVAAVVSASELPSPQEVENGLVPDGNLVLYGVLLVATLLLGMAEVLHDNASVSFIPAVVHSDQLEKANGRLWSVEMVANSFVGPPLGALLITGGFVLPFIFDAFSFAASAVLVGLIVSKTQLGRGQSAPTTGVPESADEEPAVEAPVVRQSWTAEMVEGMSWLWRHPLLRPLAIILGILNGLLALGFAIFVLFAQEVLGTSSLEFALLGTSGAFGGVIGGWSASRIIKRLGGGPTLWTTLIVSGSMSIIIGFAFHWAIVWVALALTMLMGTVWNVLTVSLRQRIIPDDLLGRVNAVYRFFGLGMMPIGALLGGVMVVAVESMSNREWALRVPWVVVGVLEIVLLAYAAPRLTSSAIQAAEEAAEALKAETDPPAEPA